MTEQDIQFIPFNAINEFMRNDYRTTVIRTVLTAAPELPENLRKPIIQAVKKHVKVPGFRNAEKAPAAIKAIAMGKAFEKNADVVINVIAAWAEIHAELHQQVSALLDAHGWKEFPTEISLESLSAEKIKEWGILPPNVDRTRLPGFVTTWPKDNDFETLYNAFVEMYPNVEESIDNVSLMVVWISMRLPIDIEGLDDKNDEESE